jgi:hypothetical protein
VSVYHDDESPLFKSLLVLPLLLGGCSSTPVEDSGSPTTYPLFFTTMTHMEGGHADDQIERVFTNHVETLRSTIALASQYNGMITPLIDLPRG